MCVIFSRAAMCVCEWVVVVVVECNKNNNYISFNACSTEYFEYFHGMCVCLFATYTENSKLKCMGMGICFDIEQYFLILWLPVPMLPCNVQETFFLSTIDDGDGMAFIVDRLLRIYRPTFISAAYIQHTCWKFLYKLERFFLIFC